MKLAILQLADQGPALSTAAMLRAVGYEVAIPNDALRDMLQAIGCDTVLSPRGLHEGMGYDPLDLPEVGIEAMDTCDLYLDVKGHRNCPKIWKVWPRLKNLSMWVRFNGGKPEHVRRQSKDQFGNTSIEDCGDEVNPGLPILTPNMWYRGDPKAYVAWVPFVGWGDYFDRHGRTVEGYHKSPDGLIFRDPQPGDLLKGDAPVCLIHGVEGWGYSGLIEWVRYHGVKCYGSHGSPDGLVPHSLVPKMLSRARCLVSLRSNDCPGYAMYEAAAAACPMIVPRRLIHRMQMEDWLIPNETCLVFDGIEPGRIDIEACAAEIKEGLDSLLDPGENSRIGFACREKLRSLMWSADRAEDVMLFKMFMQRHFW